MYTKKLLRTTWNIKEVLSLVAVFAVIVAIFSFIEFQDARGDLDDLYKKSSTVTQEQIDKISVASPVGLMAMVAALGFGLPSQRRCSASRFRSTSPESICTAQRSCPS